jgi:hypothetical protein
LKGPGSLFSLSPDWLVYLLFSESEKNKAF